MMRHRFVATQRVIELAERCVHALCPEQNREIDPKSTGGTSIPRLIASPRVWFSAAGGWGALSMARSVELLPSGS